MSAAASSRIHVKERSMRRLLFAVTALVAVCASALAGPSAQASTTTARALLSKLTVKAESGSGTYSRSYFRHWIDADGDRCDTREEVLIAESKVTVRFGSGCRVTTGKWYSWYDGATWTNASDLDIDHVVALKEAWESGARSWSSTNRTRYQGAPQCSVLLGGGEAACSI